MRSFIGKFYEIQWLKIQFASARIDPALHDSCIDRHRKTVHEYFYGYYLQLLSYEMGCLSQYIVYFIYFPLYHLHNGGLFLFYMHIFTCILFYTCLFFVYYTKNLLFKKFCRNQVNFQIIL